MTPTRVSALAAVYREGAIGNVGNVGNDGVADATPGIIIAERCGLNLLVLRGAASDNNWVAAAQSAIAIALPTTPGMAATTAACSALCLAADEWLISGNAASVGDLALNGGARVDVSHGRTVLRLSGPRTRDLLAKGCSLDLHPSVFKAGHCAQTTLARINVLIHLRNQDGAFDLYCPRSYALSLWHWVTTSAAEFGYAVAAPLWETP